MKGRKKGYNIFVSQDYSTEEREITALLLKNGSVLTQAEIVAQTGYSEPKISVVLARMHEKGLIQKSRLTRGKGNLIKLISDQTKKEDEKNKMINE